MSLNSNTQELNEILEMAKSLPVADNGESTEEVVYVDALFDFSTFSVVSIDKTYAEIVALIEAGKYIVARATYALVAAPVNVAYFPLSANAVEQNNLLFSGMINTALNGQNVLLSVSVFMFTDNSTNVRARVVSTTDLN